LSSFSLRLAETIFAATPVGVLFAVSDRNTVPAPSVTETSSKGNIPGSSTESRLPGATGSKSAQITASPFAGSAIHQRPPSY